MFAVEQFGEPPALGTGERVLEHAVGDHEGRDDEDEDTGVHREEHQYAERDAANEHTHEVERAAADLVGELGPAEGGEDADRSRDAQRARVWDLVANSALFR